ncbi:MAG TPA: hypothetical protein VN903_39680 [Polyangia bacterium]|jgi:hypothetical protein|nr:hypothetical protein [Polyangia bacterium]
MSEEITAAPWRTKAWLVAALVAGAASGCAAPAAVNRPAPVTMPQGLVGMRFRVRKAASPLEQEVASALAVELARAGIVVLTDDALASDADVKVQLDLRQVGPIIEGRAGVLVEHGGTLLDGMWTSVDVYRSDHFAELVARRLAEWFPTSPRVAWLNAAPPPAAQASLPPVSDLAVDEAPSAPTMPRPPTLGRSGRFGLGLGLELQLGWAQVFAPGGSPDGVHLALGVQADLGPRAAFRLPLSVQAAGSGNSALSEVSLVPAFIYRFRNRANQTVVPYVGLGMKLIFVEAGRPLLGRPDTGVKSPDSCGRYHNSTIRDCGFAISPEPTAGIEWHSNRWFALDAAAAYSFAHLTSSTGLVSWIHVLSIYVGPRLTF